MIARHATRLLSTPMIRVPLRPFRCIRSWALDQISSDNTCALTAEASPIEHAPADDERSVHVGGCE